MAINRAPYNALVDDNGTGTTGSVWNKAAIKSVLLDPIDATPATTQVASNVVGAQPAFAPGLDSDTLIWWYGATDMTLQGLAAGATGRRVTLINAGGAVCYVANESPAAAVANRLINKITGGATPIAPRGAASWVYDSQQWRMTSHDQGAWIDVPFNVANFWAGVTAGMVGANRYTVQGKTLIWNLQLVGAPAPPATPYMSLGSPIVGALVSGGCFGVTSFASDSASGQVVGQIFVGNSSVIQVAKFTPGNGSNWSGTVRVDFTINATLL